jgi:hypothetical protein
MAPIFTIALGNSKLNLNPKSPLIFPAYFCTMFFVLESLHKRWSDSNTALPSLRFLKYETSKLLSVSLSRAIRVDESPLWGHIVCNWLRKEGLIVGSGLPVVVKLNSLYLTNRHAVVPMVWAPKIYAISVYGSHIDLKKTL